MTPDLEQRPPTARPLAEPHPHSPGIPFSRRDETETLLSSSVDHERPRHRAVGGNEDAIVPVEVQTPDGIETLARAQERPEIDRSSGARRRVSVRSALFIALLVGAAFAALWPIAYQNTCTFNVSPHRDFDLPKVRAALLDFLWANANLKPGEWNVSSPKENKLQLSLLTSGSPQTHNGEQLSREFIQHLRRTLSEQTTPTESETYLTRLLADAQEKLQDANIMKAAPSSTNTNPLTQRNESIGERSALAARYANASEAWTQAQQRLENLTQSGPPTSSVVAQDVLLQAQQADQTLQQDLRELHVRLTELRAELMAAIQQASEKLPPVANAANALLDLLKNGEETSDVAVTAATNGLETSAANYINRLQLFSQEFAVAARTIDATTADPLRDDFINAYVKIQKLAGDFFFDASRLLTAMRTQIDALNEGEAAAPRNYQFASDLTRAFGQAQTAHHRFEFAAAKIDSANNFRLDSALRSSRGLRSRTRDRLASIDKALQAQALQHARAQYARDLLDAQTANKTARAELDAAVGQLLQADESVVASIAPSDEFLEAVIRRELAEATASQVQELLDRLAARRESLTAEPLVTLGSLQTSLAPHDLSRRLIISTLAAAIAFLSLLVGQYLSVPRRVSERLAAARCE